MGSGTCECYAYDYTAHNSQLVPTRLRQLRQEHVQSGSAEPFPCPSGYTPGRRYDLDRTSPPSCDRYLMNQPTMVCAKAELPSWFWTECNIALNRALSNGSLPSGGPASASAERVYGIRAAQRFFHRHSARYAGRPPDPVSTGRSIWLPMLRSSLSNAPTISANLRNTDAWGPEKDRLRFHAGNYEWGDEYLRGIFRQLCSLIGSLGVEDAGWKSIRWEIYHRVRMPACRGTSADSLSKVREVSRQRAALRRARQVLDGPGGSMARRPDRTPACTGQHARTGRGGA